jgi:hypothetical protein
VSITDRIILEKENTRLAADNRRLRELIKGDKTGRIDIKEFREIGFLQEANRLFFHPLGLALEVTQDADDSERLSGIWDYRDDPEGVIFVDGVINKQKIARVEVEKNQHFYARAQLFAGPNIQPFEYRKG